MLSFPQPGWDERVMEEKFRWLAGHVLAAPAVDQLVEMLWRFDEIPDVRELTRLLA